MHIKFWQARIERFKRLATSEPKPGTSEHEAWRDRMARLFDTEEDFGRAVDEICPPQRFE